jgi:hypothetical protein
MEYMIAGSVSTRELQLFERDIVFMPSWTLSEIPKGVTDLDISPTGDMICFANGTDGLDVLNVGRIV